MTWMMPCERLLTMKPTQKLVFILCTLLVLGFLHYASWKIHLLVWSQKALHNIQATKEPLRKTLPPEDGNPSKKDCKKGYAAERMTNIYPKFVKKVPMFLDQNFRLLPKVKDYLPPFGLKTQEKHIEEILNTTKNYRLGKDLDSLSCKRCVIVGNGGILSEKNLGSHIDMYDIVVRLNGAPVHGYHKNVGTKTTMRITYPEGAFQNLNLYDKTSLFVLSAFKPEDIKWLKHMAFKERLPALPIVFCQILHLTPRQCTLLPGLPVQRSTKGFWKSVANRVPQEPSKMRILNPYFIQEAAFQFMLLPKNNGEMGNGNTPTLGAIAITMALHNCDEVAVAGFSYDLNKPSALLHYWEKTKMSAIKEKKLQNRKMGNDLAWREATHRILVAHTVPSEPKTGELRWHHTSTFTTSNP
ncbi:CMP-N-acetylneuraminate-beta-1,4-galactoside alpha-2,3-sialyltransferase-like isoform X5 [Channa argus]